MKLTKSQLKQIITEALEDQPASPMGPPGPGKTAAVPTGIPGTRAMYARVLAEEIAKMIRAHEREHWEGGRMDRGSLLYVLEQAEKKYNELAAQRPE